MNEKIKNDVEASIITIEEHISVHSPLTNEETNNLINLLNKLGGAL